MCSAIRHGDYKLLWFYNGNRLELYNLKNDPAESKNLIKTQPEKGTELKKMLDIWLKEVNAEEPDWSLIKKKNNVT